jgi:hypothetical protein
VAAPPAVGVGSDVTGVLSRWRWNSNSVVIQERRAESGHGRIGKPQPTQTPMVIRGIPCRRDQTGNTGLVWWVGGPTPTSTAGVLSKNGLDVGYSVCITSRPVVARTSMRGPVSLKMSVHSQELVARHEDARSVHHSVKLPREAPAFDIEGGRCGSVELGSAITCSDPEQSPPCQFVP